MRTATSISGVSAQCSTSARFLPLKHACNGRHLLGIRHASALAPAAAQSLSAFRSVGRHAVHVCAAAATETKEETFTYQAEVSFKLAALPACCPQSTSVQYAADRLPPTTSWVLHDHSRVPSVLDGRSSSAGKQTRYMITEAHSYVRV